MIVCPNCREQLTDAVRFCKHCGAPIAETVVYNSAQHTIPENMQNTSYNMNCNTQMQYNMQPSLSAKKPINKMLKFITCFLLITTFLMVISPFLSYGISTEKGLDRLELYSEEAFEEFGMSSEDFEDISMIEYAKVYFNNSEDLFDDSSFGIIYIVLVGILILFSLFAMLFSWLKKPVVLIVFDVLAFVVFSIHNWDFEDRGVIPSAILDWGVGYYLFYIASSLTFIGAILMLVYKSNLKKA